MNEPEVTLASLTRAPFSLDAESIAWVQRTRDRLSTEQKLRQLINEASMSDDLAAAQSLAAFQLGGVTRFIGADVQAAWHATRAACNR